MPTPDSSSIVIVGAGHCGGRTAQHLREFGFTGSIDLVGDEASLPYERPPLSKDVLVCTKHLDELDIMPMNVMHELGLTQHLATVVSVDAVRNAAELSNGKTLTYSALLFANGGSPRRLGIPGEDLPGVLRLRTKDDALRLSERLKGGQHIVVVGGGFIGLEVAASARKLRCEVTLLESGTQIMGRAVPATLAERARLVHLAKGVQLHCNLSPVHIAQVKQRLELTLSNGSTLLADTVVVGIGIAADVQIAQAAGVAVARGILVDAQLRTNIANIYAAGDVAEFPSPVSGACVRQETWSNAESQARVVAQNLAGGQVAFEAKSWFWSDQYDYQLQVCGEPSAAVTSVERALEDGDLILFYLDAGGRVVGASGWGLTARIAKEMKLARALVEREVHTSALALADPLTRLKSLL